MYFRCGLWFSMKNAFFMIFQSKIVKNRPQMYLLTEIHDMKRFWTRNGTYFRCGLWFQVKIAFSMIFQSKLVKNRLKIYLLTEIDDLNGFGLGMACIFEPNNSFAEICIFDDFSVKNR
jgi:hypothetical protein